VIIKNASWSTTNPAVDGNAGNLSDNTTTPSDYVFDPNSLEYGVEVLGFRGGQHGDKVNMIFDTSAGASTIQSNGQLINYTLNSGTTLNGTSSGTVIALNSNSHQFSDNASANLSQVATLLSGFNGAALNLLGDGQYTIVIYSSNTSDADAHLFNIRVHGGDGFDLRSTAGQIIDNDAIEYMGVLREVGAGILVGDNFTL